MRVLTDLHVHTLASGHAFSTLKEIVDSAIGAGLEAVAITDHGPSMEGSAHSGYFDMATRVPGEIDGLRIWMGIEAVSYSEKCS